MTNTAMTRAALLAVMAFAPTPAWAQEAQDEARGKYGRVSVSIGQAYEDNLFAVPASRSPRSDLVSRLGPAFEAGYLSFPFALITRYAVDAERYLTNVELNNNIARK